jgi:rRNA maturation RNase YbeY
MICFYTENIIFNLPQKREVKAWLTMVARQENKQIGTVSVIFCSDEYLLPINRCYLQHDYYTDIIAFDYTEANRISGDLFISVDRVRANGEKYKQSFRDELHLVILHGILHLCGYGDATPAQKKTMREKENKYLGMRFS